MGVALALQWARLSALDSCIRSGRANGYGTGSCRGDDLDIVGGYYGALGMAMFVGGAAGGGAMLGNAAAHRDVQLYKGVPRRRTGAKLLGAASIVAGAAWMIGANWTLLGKEAQCETGECLMKYRPLRYAANDSGALAIGLGACAHRLRRPLRQAGQSADEAACRSFAVALDRRPVAVGSILGHRASPALGAEQGVLRTRTACDRVP